MISVSTFYGYIKWYTILENKFTINLSYFMKTVNRNTLLSENFFWRAYFFKFLLGHGRHISGTISGNRSTIISDSSRNLTLIFTFQSFIFPFLVSGSLLWTSFLAVFVYVKSRTACYHQIELIIHLQKY